MPQFQQAVLKDRADPQMSHTYKPRDITAGVATMVESTGIPIGDRVITLSQTRTGSGRIKILIKIKIPVVQDAIVNGVSRPTVVRTNYGEISFNFDSSSTTRERDDLAELITEITRWADNPMFGSYIVDLEGLF